MMQQFMDTSIEGYRTIWLSQAQFEATKQRSRRHQRGRGSCVLFILDVSESMRGRAFREMKTAVMDILDEFTQHRPRLDENVSVIVFGQETKFLHYYSNQYAAIKQSIEELECSGPSPLTAAFMLALGGLFNGAAHSVQVGDFQLHPRVVVFTDGKPTDFRNLNTSDIETDQTPDTRLMAILCSHTSQIGENHPIFCFPVGENPNYALLQTISSLSNGGKVLETRKAKCFGRYVMHHVAAGRISKATNEKIIERENLRFVADLLIPDETYDEDDLDIIYELIHNRERILETQNRMDEDSDDLNYKEKYSTVPCLGTRVCRGPHWKSQNQDSEGNGTIVGHGDKAGFVRVEWDNGNRSVYNYGINDVYDIVICDEPRIPIDGFVAVGCYVKRGPDWKWEEQDGGKGSIGTTYRVMDNASVYVRWPCGRMGNYRFGYDGKYDIEVCDPFSPDVKKAVTEQWRTSQISASLHSLPSTDFKGDFAAKGSHYNRPNESHQNKEHKGPSAWMNEKSDLCSNDVMLRNETSVDSTETKHFYRSESNIRAGQTLSTDRTNMTDSSSELQSPMGVDDLQTDFVSNFSPKNDLQTREVGHSDTRRPVSPNDFQNTLYAIQNSSPGDKQASVSDVTMTANQRKKSMTNKEMGSNIPPLLKNVIGSKNISTNSSRCWQWRDSNGHWVDYPDHVNDFINHRLQQRPQSTVVINYNAQSFRLVASRMIQINTDTKETHRVRWKNM
ncbi:uncharacterized protein LOC125650560 isoform X1 [Ostrea edulis]|uniref:uncharacterized protein LOC125650560 isoform X1 n=3 Tax=Ostrea edulis TaxID=37623 RepID=UPI0024AF7D7F|nr:uncharacterized protein LOC125650560 isoform X1 [Ostrea edulis]